MRGSGEGATVERTHSSQLWTKAHDGRCHLVQVALRHKKDPAADRPVWYMQLGSLLFPLMPVKLPFSCAVSPCVGANPAQCVVCCSHWCQWSCLSRVLWAPVLVPTQPSVYRFSVDVHGLCSSLNTLSLCAVVNVLLVCVTVTLTVLFDFGKLFFHCVSQWLSLCSVVNCSFTVCPSDFHCALW